jgi:CubicO group peptidase (beta-lactamase class C family)
VFAYCNSGMVLAGRVVELITGAHYANAVQRLLLAPLGLGQTFFSSSAPPPPGAAVPHVVVDGKAVVDLSGWLLSVSDYPSGGLISSVKDQVRWARFHLGDGRAPSGERLLTKHSLSEMQTHPGPGGTLIVELDGMGVSWMIRPTAEGPKVIQHGGSGTGQLSGFMMVPSRRFAMTLLTNSSGAGALRNYLFTDDWALRRFAGVSNLPAKPTKLSPTELALFEGPYRREIIDEKGSKDTVVIEVRGQDGRLQGTVSSGGHSEALGAAFYRPDYVIDLDSTGEPTGTRSNFVRGLDGNVVWWRQGGRLFRHEI